MQLPEGAQWTRVGSTALGTVTIKPSRTALYGVLIGQNKTGTCAIYDSASGTTTRLFSTIDNTCGTSPQFVTAIANMRFGITVVTSGTTDMTFIYQ